MPFIQRAQSSQSIIINEAAQHSTAIHTPTAEVMLLILPLPGQKSQPSTSSLAPFHVASWWYQGLSLIQTTWGGKKKNSEEPAPALELHHRQVSHEVSPALLPAASAVCSQAPTLMGTPVGYGLLGGRKPSAPQHTRWAATMQGLSKQKMCSWCSCTSQSFSYHEPLTQINSLGYYLSLPPNGILTFLSIPSKARHQHPPQNNIGMSASKLPSAKRSYMYAYVLWEA